MKTTHREYDPKDNQLPLPKRLVDLRKAAGKTQEEIGKELGVSNSNYASYEAGKTLPPVDKIIKLANYYNVSTDYLLGLSDAKTNDVTETAICEYLNLDIDTVRSLHGTASNKKLHTVIDFLFKEKQLLVLITHYAWSTIPRLLYLTDYRFLFFSDLRRQEAEEKIIYSSLIFYLRDFNGKFMQMCKERIHEFDSIFQEFVMNHMDADNIFDYLAHIGADDVIRESLTSFDFQKYKEGCVFEECLEGGDRRKYRAFTRRPLKKQHPWDSDHQGFFPRTEEEKGIFIKTASHVLNNRMKTPNFRRQARLDCIERPDSGLTISDILESLDRIEPMTDALSNDDLKEEEYGNETRENN